MLVISLADKKIERICIKLGDEFVYIYRSRYDSKKICIDAMSSVIIEHETFSEDELKWLPNQKCCYSE